MSKTLRGSRASRGFWTRTGWLAAAVATCSSWLAPAAEAFVRRDGRHIKDPWGNTVVIRGVEMNHGQDSHIPEINKSNANYVRFLFWANYGNVDANFPNFVENCIRTAVEHHMLVSIGFVGLPGSDNYQKTQWGVNWIINNKAMLMKYERHLILHGMGEAFGDVTAWRNDNLYFLQQLRNAGYKCPIDVVSTDGGRNIHTVLNNGQWLMDNDPQSNLILGWQAYWPWNQALTANFWQGSNGMTLSQAIDAIATKNFPIQIGNATWDDYSGDQHYIDYKTIMSKAQQHGVGWAVWNWSGEDGGSLGGTPMTKSWQGTYGNWYSTPSYHPFGSDTGYQVVEGHAASIKKTSVRTAFLNGTGDGRGLKAEYFDNGNFTGLLSTRIDREINNNYGNGAPNVAGMGADDFSVRWSGSVQAPVTGTYVFETTTDDGVRLWINNNLLIDKWFGQAPTSYTASVSLQAGQKYNLRMDYYEGGGGAYARLRWLTPGASQQVVIPSIYLFDSGATSGGATKYEAENATRNVGVASNHAGYSGSGFAAGFGNVGDYVSFAVNVPSAGNRTVTLRYANGYSTNSSLSVYVNGTKIKQTVLPPSGSWSSWADKAETLNLNSGNNTIMYRRDSGDAGQLNVDYILVQ
jgi:hypothetical protein